jgi:hypothetical protein
MLDKDAESSASSSWDERRQFARRPFVGPVTIIIADLNHVFATGVDISDGGLCVTIHRAMRFTPGERISVRVTRDDRRRPATVINRSPRGLHLSWIH